MREDKGITLISLVIYIIGMVAIIAVVGSLLSFYNNNMVKMNDTSDVNMELSKFSARMIAETKEAGNEIAEITGSTIRFKNGNVYTYQDNRIYENTMVVSQYVKDYLASLEVDGSKQILRIHIVLQKGETEITNNLTYVIEETKGQVAMGPTYIINNAGDITVKAENESITITEGDSNNIEQYFTYTTNGNLPPTSIKYIDTSNNDVEITNTNNLAVGTHQIKCTIINAKGDSVSTTMTIVVEPKLDVFGNLYKISDTEYHLIFNTTGNIAQGYTESQLVAKGTNIKDGIHTSVEFSTGVIVSSQPWGAYSEKITKVKIEEEIKPRSIARYFLGLTQIAEIERIDNIDTTYVTSMRSTFYGCSGLTTVDVSGFDTKNVTDMSTMFQKCSSLTNIDVSGFDTKKVEKFGWMFANCSSLTEIDVSEFKTENATSIDGMFFGCSKLTNIDLSSFDTKNMTDIHQLAAECTNLVSINLSSFNTEKVTNMSYMLCRCSNLLNVDFSSFNTKNVTNMLAMFYSCKKLKKIYVGNEWSVENVTQSNDMFYDCPELSGAISYNSSKTNATYANYTTGYLTYKAPTTT